MKFTKMHGLGNDFILLDNIDGSHNDFDLVLFAKKYCERNFGVGADGVLVMSASNDADVRMQVINADGSEAEMCGNGIRCAAKYLIDKGAAGSPVKIETLAGIKTVEKVGDNYRVDMGIPEIGGGEVEIDGYKATLVDIGNPHAVIFVEDFNFDWEAIGKAIEYDTLFPNRTNVEFVIVNSPNELEVKVWERGAGATLACGTGACASLAAAVANQKSANKAKLSLPGGVLEVELAEDKHIYMTGPAETVFSGKIAL